MSFDDAVHRCLARYANFAGRARPSEFWWFALLYAVVAETTAAASASASDLALPGVILVLALTPPMAAVTMRRLHDASVGPWALLFLVPLAGQAALLVWLMRPSLPRPNRFGPPPASRDGKFLLYLR